MSLVDSIRRHKEELDAAAQSAPFIVFLCGPTLADKANVSAQYRARLKAALEAQHFEVVLGEDDGLEEARLKIGLNAQDNELEFISRFCNAVIIIADSVGAFCELGLFSWHFVHEDGRLKNDRRTDCIVLVNARYQKDRSYLNEGPGAAVNGFGRLEFVDFAEHDVEPIVRRLKDRRAVITVDNRRGRPRKPAS